MMTRPDLEEWLARRGYVRDRWGHWQRTATVPVRGSDETRYRFRLSRTHARREVRATHADGSHAWVRLASAPYSALSLDADDRLLGLRR